MKCGSRLAAALSVVAFGAWCATAPAAVIPYTQIDQDRQIQVTVTAAGGVGSTPVEDGAGESSNATGSFSRAMEYQVTGRDAPPGLNSSTAFGAAEQSVVFGDTAIFGTLSATATASHAGGSSRALANSRFSTHFTVAQETPFNLDGQITMSSSGLGAVGQFVEQFVFSGGVPGSGQTEFFAQVGEGGGNGGGTFPLRASGVLHPGWTYVLSVQLLGDKSTDGGAGVVKSASGRADFVLTVPEPGGVAALAAAAAAAAAATLRRRHRAA
jgi:hypothetical protein